MYVCIGIPCVSIHSNESTTMYAYYSLESNSVVLCIVSMRNNTVRRARNLHDECTYSST